MQVIRRKSILFSIVPILVIFLFGVSTLYGSTATLRGLVPPSVRSENPSTPIHAHTQTQIPSNSTGSSNVISSDPLIISHLVRTANSIIYVTNFGNYTFSKSTPWKLSSFVDRSGKQLATTGFFTIANFTTFVSGYSIKTETGSLFSVEYTLSQTGSRIGNVGNMTVSYNFDYKPVNDVPIKPIVSLEFSSSIANLSVGWAIALQHGHYIAYMQGKSTRMVSEVSSSASSSITEGQMQNSRELLVGPNPSTSLWSKDILSIDWSDSGLSALVQEGQISALSHTGVLIVFPEGVSSIDPTIATANVDNSIASSSQRKTFFSDGLFWTFFVDTNSKIAYSSSVNGSVFSSPTETSYQVNSGRDFTVYNANNESLVYIAVTNQTQNGFYTSGLLWNNGTITWAAPTAITGMTDESLTDPSISVDLQGNVYVSAYSSDSNYVQSYLGYMPADVTSNYLFFKNGVLIQTVEAAPQAGLVLGNGNTTGTYYPAEYGIAEEFTVPVDSSPIDGYNINVMYINTGTFYFAMYNASASNIPLIADASYTISSTTTSCNEMGYGSLFNGINLLAGQKIILMAYDNYNGAPAQEYYCASGNGNGVSSAESFTGAPPSTLSSNWSPTNYGPYDFYVPLTYKAISEYQMPIATGTNNSGYFVYSSGNTTANTLVGLNTTNVSTQTVINNNTFSSMTMDGWSNYGSGSSGVYSSIGNPAPSVGSTETVAGETGIQKTITWSGAGSFILSFDWKTQVTSGYDTSVNVMIGNSNAMLDFSGSVTNTGWEHYVQDLSNFVQGQTSVTITIFANGVASGITTQLFLDNIVVQTAPNPTVSSLATNLDAGDSETSVAYLNSSIYLTYVNQSSSGSSSIHFEQISGATPTILNSAIIQTGIDVPVHPVISINNASGDAYVFWAGYPIQNYVYFAFFNATTATMTPVVTWLNATDLAPGLSGNDQMISVAEYAVNGLIGATYETGLTSPFSIQYSVLSDPPSVQATDLYNGIQGAQDYLTRLERNTNGTSLLSEYPSIPLTIKYSDGCYELGQSGGSQQDASCTFGGNASITTNVINQTQNIFTYYFYSPHDSTCAGLGDSPALQVRETYFGYKSNGPAFQVTVNSTIIAMSDNSPGCNFSIYLGPTLLGSGLTQANLYNEFDYSGNLLTYPRGGGGINYGLDFSFNQFSTPGVISTPQLDSFRYANLGLQSEVNWATASVQPIWNETAYAGTLTPQVSTELRSVSVPYTSEATYTPQWLYGENLPWNFEDNASTSGGPYTQCSTSQSVVYEGYSSVMGFAYPYSSSICSYGVSNYLNGVWSKDPLIMSETALQVLNTYGPYDMVIPWNGSTVSPAGFANDIVNSNWFNSTYGISYPYVCGSSLCANTTLFSATRTAAFGELATILGYKYNFTQFQPTADSMINALIKAQWGLGCPANCISEGFRVPVGGGNTVAYGPLFRPDNTGGMEIAWTQNYNETTPSGTGLSATFNDINNMPKEYAGPIITDQEATQAALAAFEVYYNLVTNPANPSLNDGVQPFFNQMFHNSGNTVVTKQFSPLGIYASQTFNMTVMAVDEGDPANRTLNVYMNGSLWASTTLVGNSVDTPQTFTFPLGILDSNYTYTIGISLNTTQPTNDGYVAPQYWWLASASIYGIPAPNKVINASLVYCIPPLVDQTFSFKSEYGISGIGYGGANATVTNNDACQVVPIDMVFNIINSNGQTVPYPLIIPVGPVQPSASVTAWAESTLPAGSYTVDIFVVLPDMVPVSLAASPVSIIVS
ncbi:MAG: hypothetical protein JRN15_05550 [Nitrososphaerota archaeon]|nr:hypothetical protein [Nitrososphaerota archaeon]